MPRNASFERSDPRFASVALNRIHRVQTIRPFVFVRFQLFVLFYMTEQFLSTRRLAVP